MKFSGRHLQLPEPTEFTLPLVMHNKHLSKASPKLKWYYFCGMTLELIAIGKTDSPELQKLIADYKNRLGHYVNFRLSILLDIKNTKNLSEAQQKEKEGELFLKHITKSDIVVLLDEKGKELTSVGFSDYLQKKMNAGHKKLVLLIGGPYGFSPSLYQRAQEKISLSKMTFSHQMIRLFIVEQCYRAFTILRNEPYHHR